MLKALYSSCAGNYGNTQTATLALACMVELSIASNFGPSNFGTRDIVSISNRPTVLFGGIFPAFGRRRVGGWEGEGEGVGGEGRSEEGKRKGGKEKGRRREAGREGGKEKGRDTSVYENLKQPPP